MLVKSYYEKKNCPNNLIYITTVTYIHKDKEKKKLKLLDKMMKPKDWFTQAQAWKICNAQI